VISEPGKKILFLSDTVPGSIHDYALCKIEFPPDQPWFKKVEIEVDLGFQGIVTDYPYACAIRIPYKKPRKSKNNPNPVLTERQKKHNRTLAITRVAVEHAIGGMKSFHSLVHRARNHLMPLLDTFIHLGAGLWNFKLSS
jgi:DDE superfamily endonuclease